MLNSNAIKTELPDFIPHWLAGNDFFAAGLGITALGTSLAIFKNMGSVGARLLRRRFTSTIEITSKDPSYKNLMRWLLTQSKHSRRLGVETRILTDHQGRQVAHFDFVPSTGSHLFWFNNYPLLIQRTRDSKLMDLTNVAPWETMTITSLSSFTRTVCEDLLRESETLVDKSNSGKITIYQPIGSEWHQFGLPKSARPFSSVVLGGKISTSVLDDVVNFIESRNWYLDRGIPYHRGYLLHGPPGCGKSSFVMALAGLLEYSIAILNLGDGNLSDNRLQQLLSVVPQRTLVLLEDIDAALAKLPSRTTQSLTFSGILNALDGVASTDERIVFMTGNHCDTLPPELLRPGRVDLRVYVGHATGFQAGQMCARFYPEATADEVRQFRDFFSKLAGEIVTEEDIIRWEKYYIPHLLEPENILEKNEISEKNEEPKSNEKDKNFNSSDSKLESNIINGLSVKSVVNGKKSTITENKSVYTKIEKEESTKVILEDTFGQLKAKYPETNTAPLHRTYAPAAIQGYLLFFKNDINGALKNLTDAFSIETNTSNNN